MTNETLLETYQSVKELIANNLREKGVEASSNDGLTTLAGKILDIEVYQEKKSLTVQKVWIDDNNLQRVRPTSLGVVLKRNNENYRTVVLKEDDGWSKTISVPIYYNGEEAEYSWVESEIPGYTLYSIEVDNNITTLTNANPPSVPENPPSGKTPK